jgi:hypothetical protein
MHDPIIIAGPLLIAAVVVAVRFVGCSLDEGGTGVPAPYSTVILPTAHLVSFWRLNDTSFTKAADSSDGNTGKYQNTGGVTLGVPPGLANTDTDNTGAKFDGGTGSPSTGGGYVSVPFASNLNPAKFTVEALVNPSAVDASDYHAVVSSRSIDTTTLDTAGYIVYLHGADFEAWIGNGTTAWPSAVVNAGVAANSGPYYLAMTYDGTTLKLYVNPANAEPDLTAEEFAQTAATHTPTTKNELRIGAGANEEAVPQYDFPGVIQDVAIYDDALDFTTIQSHFSIAMTGFSP